MHPPNLSNLRVLKSRLSWTSLGPLIKVRLLIEMVFCYQNCSSDREKLLKGDGREFAKFLRSLEQFIQTVKGQNNSGNRMLF